MSYWSWDLKRCDPIHLWYDLNLFGVDCGDVAAPGCRRRKALLGFHSVRDLLYNSSVCHLSSAAIQSQVWTLRLDIWSWRHWSWDFVWNCSRDSHNLRSCKLISIISAISSTVSPPDCVCYQNAGWTVCATLWCIVYCLTDSNSYLWAPICTLKCNCLLYSASSILQCNAKVLLDDGHDVALIHAMCYVC